MPLMPLPRQNENAFFTCMLMALLLRAGLNSLRKIQISSKSKKIPTDLVFFLVKKNVLEKDGDCFCFFVIASSRWSVSPAFFLVELRVRPMCLTERGLSS